MDLVMDLVITRSEFLSLPLIAAGRAFGAAAPSRQEILDGRAQPEPELIELAAGPLTMMFQPDIGFLRYVAYGEREVVRGAYAAVRDRSWGTVAPRITNIKLDRRAGGFDLTFDVDCIQRDIAFRWKGVLRGDPSGSVRFAMDGVAESTFLRNRIGFCVLHPMRECAGQPCIVEHTGGEREKGRFPDLISPHQPFKEIAAITHTVAPGISATVRFEGEVFEMEDHRNWTDSNFKTYCTPLERPYPVRVEKGAQIAQSVTLRLDGAASGAAVKRSKSDAVRLELVESGRRKLPRIGFGLGAADPGEDDLKRLRVLKAAHVRADLHLSNAGWRGELRRALRLSSAMEAPLECAIFVTDDADSQLGAFAAEAGRAEARVTRFLVFHEKESSTSARWIELAKKRLPGGAALGAGTNQFFTELNRGRPPAKLLDALCYSINPQVHAFDNMSLMENLESQAETARTARSFAGGRAIAVSPVTLRPRSNPEADPRQRSLFGAVWTLGSIARLAAAGTESVTYYELTGPAGLMAGGVFPLYHVFADLAEFAGGDVVPVRSGDPLRAEALLVSLGKRQRLIVANLAGRTQRVALPASFRALRVRRLDAAAFPEATRNSARWRGTAERFSGAELSLEPYALALCE